MVILMHFQYDASDKVTLVLCSDKLGFMPLLDLAIDLRSVLLEINRKSCNLTKSRTLFLKVHYPLVSIARPILSTNPSTLADQVPFLKCAIHRENVSCNTR